MAEPILLAINAPERVSEPKGHGMSSVVRGTNTENGTESLRDFQYGQSTAFAILTIAHTGRWFFYNTVNAFTH